MIKYGIEFFVNTEQTAEGMLDSLFMSFRTQKQGEKIYVIIDEYDHFANELLSFNTEQFKNLVSKNGKVRKWYEILKEGTETIVDRIFITGVAPITLDSLTSGFNIGKDISQDFRFNEMMGFTKKELIQVMEEQEITKKHQEKIFPIMKENYDGYKFSLDGKEKLYNSNMCLYFLNDYLAIGDIPRQLIDVNIASDYSKLGNMLDLCKGEDREKVIEKTIEGEGIVSEITQKFNPQVEFTQKDLVSMLYYLGYLTISGEEVGYPKLNIPNQVMKEIYSDYFLKTLKNEIKIDIEQNYIEMAREIALEGSIEKIIENLHMYLKGLSNRDFQRFDEKYVKLIFYCLAKNMNIYSVKSEMEVQRRYPDIMLIPKDTTKGYYSVMIEFKYLKKNEEHMLEEKKKEAIKQIKEYSNFEEISKIEKIKKYAVIAVVDKICVEECKD